MVSLVSNCFVWGNNYYEFCNVIHDAKAAFFLLYLVEKSIGKMFFTDNASIEIYFIINLYCIL